MRDRPEKIPRLAGFPRTLASSSENIATAGDTNENVLRSLVFPANSIRVGDIITVKIYGFALLSANISYRVRFGGTLFPGFPITNGVNHSFVLDMMFGRASSGTLEYGGTLTIDELNNAFRGEIIPDFTVNNTFEFTSQKVTAGDTSVVEGFLVVKHSLKVN